MKEQKKKKNSETKIGKKNSLEKTFNAKSFFFFHSTTVPKLSRFNIFPFFFSQNFFPSKKKFFFYIYPSLSSRYKKTVQLICYIVTTDLCKISPLSLIKLKHQWNTIYHIYCFFLKQSIRKKRRFEKKFRVQSFLLNKF